MARRPTPSSRRRDLVYPKLPPTITLAVAATIEGDTIILTAAEPMTYNVRMSNATSALPGLIYTDANGHHHPQLVTLNDDNTVATVDFGEPILSPGTLRLATTMQALRSFRGGQIVIGSHTFPSTGPTPPPGFNPATALTAPLDMSVAFTPPWHLAITRGPLDSLDPPYIDITHPGMGDEASITEPGGTNDGPVALSDFAITQVPSGWIATPGTAGDDWFIEIDSPGPLPDPFTVTYLVWFRLATDGLIHYAAVRITHP